MYHTNASRTTHQSLSQKLLQCPNGLIACQPVQVDLRLNAEVTTAQLPKHSGLHAWPAIRQLILPLNGLMNATFEGRLIQRGGTGATRVTYALSGLVGMHRGPVMREWLYVLDGFAEEAGVLVIALRLHATSSKSVSVYCRPSSRIAPTS
jgi:hypothetical protein